MQLMGGPDSTSSDVFHDWAKVTIPREQFIRGLSEEIQQQSTDCEPLPGAEKLVSNLSHARSSSYGNAIELALASSTKTSTYRVKSSKLGTQRFLGFFEADKQILGDDSRVGKDRGKPAPDISIVALQSLRVATGTETDDNAIKPDKCLLFEDSVAIVMAGRRAGMRVVWVLHPEVAAEWQSGQKDVLAGMTRTSKLGDE